MKIVKFYGGLGNQMFQYAFLIALREKFKTDVLMDLSLYETYGLHNGFELSKVFSVSAKTANKSQIKKLGWYTNNYKAARLIHYFLPSSRSEFKERTFGKYYPSALNSDKDIIYDGYWQHWEYFDQYREAVLKEFRLKDKLDNHNQILFNEFSRSPKSVSIHVRRGDFLNSKKYRGICDINYYRNAVIKAKKTVGNDADFYIFSNDHKWCVDNLSDLISPEHFHKITHNIGADSYKDLILMSGCRLNIIANSSFSWWGAYLNIRSDKVIISPSIWINRKMPDFIQIPEWIKI